MKCPKCESTQIGKNGHHHGKQNYICKQCGRQFVESYSARGYSHDARNICLKMRANGMGFRAIERETGISHNTIINWVRQANLPDISKPEEDSELALEFTQLDRLARVQIFANLKRKGWLTLEISIYLLLNHFKDWKSFERLKS
jgi:lambda repressor-like predicted transcriptional regulator